MIAEFIQHMFLPAPAWAKRMGYGRETISMVAREKRCRAAWAPHLSACRRLIGDAAAGVEQTDKAVVLGAGPLFDIPLDDLAERFRQVDLVDAVHPRSARQAAARHANVNVVEADVSGVAEATFGLSLTANPNQARPAIPVGLRDKSCAVISDTLADNMENMAALRRLPEPAPDADLIAGADLVVSANLLSQLPLLLLDWLAAHCPWAEGEARGAFARSVVDHHLALLQNHSGRVVLITEVLRLISADGTPVEKIDPLFGAQIFADGEEWWWDIAPKGEINRRTEMRLRVLGIPDLAGAPQSRVCRNTTLAAP